MATYTAAQLAGQGTLGENLSGAKTFTFTNSGELAYFTLETVPNVNGAYDSTSPKNTSGSYTLGSGIRELIQND